MIPRRNSPGNLSIKSLLKPSSQEEKKVSIEVKREAFTQADLTDIWRKFAYSIKKKDLDLYSTLSANDPILKDNFRINVVIYNSAQEADINKKRAELLGFLRKRLNNTILDLDIVIDQSNAYSGVFTEKDKYKKLVEKNPKIDELRKKLGLSF